ALTEGRAVTDGIAPIAARAAASVASATIGTIEANGANEASAGSATAEASGTGVSAPSEIADPTHAVRGRKAGPSASGASGFPMSRRHPPRWNRGWKVGRQASRTWNAPTGRLRAAL